MKLLLRYTQKLLVSSFKFNKLSIFLLSSIVPFPTFFSSESPFCCYVDHYYGIPKLLTKTWSQNRPFSPKPSRSGKKGTSVHPTPKIHKCLTPPLTPHLIHSGTRPTVKDMTQFLPHSPPLLCQIVTDHPLPHKTQHALAPDPPAPGPQWRIWLSSSPSPQLVTDHTKPDTL